mmetsp:Transcript_148454/g.413617  ORF Transcript_148454/g.413617 Transcript_148454/m.413617 type:complete len:305 (+) Transcript_148454:67-981(+)
MAPGGALVRLRVYDASKASCVGKANRLLRPLGTGIFHSAVEVYGHEWGFGGNFVPGSTGVYPSQPGTDAQHVYREAVDLGTTALSDREVHSVLLRLEQEWLGMDYDLLRRNCSHFSAAFCKELGVGPIPAFVTSLALVGSELAALAEAALCHGQCFVESLRSWDSFLAVQRPELEHGWQERVKENICYFHANYILATAVFSVLVLLGHPLRFLGVLAVLLSWLHFLSRWDASWLLPVHGLELPIAYITFFLVVASVAFSFCIVREALCLCAVLSLLHAAAHPGRGSSALRADCVGQQHPSRGPP